MSVSTRSRGFAGAWAAAGEAPGGLTSFGGSAPRPPLFTNRKAPSSLAARRVAIRSARRRRVGTGTGHLDVLEPGVRRTTHRSGRSPADGQHVRDRAWSG